MRQIERNFGIRIGGGLGCFKGKKSIKFIKMINKIWFNEFFRLDEKLKKIINREVF